MSTGPIDLTIPARDSYPLAATLYRPEGQPRRVVLVNSATATPRRFYRHFAAALRDAGYLVLTYDYRGIGDSRPQNLRGFAATMSDWAFHDMAGVVDWIVAEHAPERLFLVGHSFGGQVAGMLDNAAAVSGMLAFSAQSGHWRLQGGEQKATVCFHVHVTLPVLSTLFGYMPWSAVGAGEDLPKGAALQWAGWCRRREYLLGDDTLPIERFQRFTAPILAYSIDDDKWGTARAVDALMAAYPNVERRHLSPTQVGLPAIGHFGYFKPGASHLWHDAITWLDHR
ncbi:alpha/beta hydrolase family protein [Haliangium sp.]|uniref:alpha/beta hydrolase family protein n=1 Tax=Haliangium sp. TaxID=2663208 RepID=UPI003D1197DD